MSGVSEDQSVTFHAAARRFDPAFKLFGSTIAVLSLGDCASKRDGRMKEGQSTVSVAENSRSRTCSQVVGGDAAESEPGSSSGSNDGCEEIKPNNGIRRAAATVPSAEFCVPVNYGDTPKSVDNVHGDTTQGKVRKKPDKPVACPRCDSLDTKFCYYNNYNVNQPRHFCKNCQRYWTAGGTLRNVPVGAGRRRNKHSATLQGSALPDDLVARDDEPDAAQQNLSCSESSFMDMNRQRKVLNSPSKLHARPLDVSSLISSDGPSSSVILNFGQDGLLCESSGATSCNANRLELLHGLGRFGGKGTVAAERDSGFSGLLEAESKLLYEKQIQSQNERSSTVNMSKEAHPTMGLQDPGKSFGTSTVSAQLVEPFSVESRMGSTTRTAPPTKGNASFGWAAGGAPFIFAGQWQHGVNIGWSNIALPAIATDLNPSSNILNPNHTQTKQGVNHLSGNITIGSPGVGIPGSVIQNPIWGPHAWGGAWAVPWAPAAANLVCGSPTLGKHRLEQDEPEDEKGGSLWVAKTSRIHDPEEAGQSSKWTTLVVGDTNESLTSDGILSDFWPKAECTEADYPHVQTQHSNSAALTRSIAFQECILASHDADA